MMKLKPIYTALTLAAFSGLLLSPLVEAARVGGGKSSGMQRSTPSKSYSGSTPAYRPAPQAAPVQPAKSGPGIGTAVAAGVAGAAAGYMLSNAINSPSQQGAVVQGQPQQVIQGGVPVQQQAVPVQGGVPVQQGVPVQGTNTVVVQQPMPVQQKSGTPWGMIFFLGALLLGGYLFMRRRSATPTTQTAGTSMSPSYQEDQTYARTYDAPPANQPMLGGGGYSSTSYGPNDRLADGTEVIHFLRAAKGYFNNLQTLNSPESAQEAKKYMTPALFNELRHEISSNRDIAEFDKLEAQVIESATENGQYVASVEFSGLVSESVGAPMVHFTETWHFVKDTHSPSAKWLLAGIQQ